MWMLLLQGAADVEIVSDMAQPCSGELPWRHEAPLVISGMITQVHVCAFPDLGRVICVRGVLLCPRSFFVVTAIVWVKQLLVELFASVADNQTRATQLTGL